MDPTCSAAVSDLSNDINRELNPILFDELVVVLNSFNDKSKKGALTLTRIGSRSAIMEGGI